MGTLNPVDIDALYKKWEKGGPPNLTYPSLKGLYQWFLRECEKRGVDPESVDFVALVDPSLTYAENKTILAEMMISPPTEEEYERMYQETKEYIQKEVRERYPEVIEPLEERIVELEREKDKAKRYKQLVKELKLQLAETEKRLEEERARPPKVMPVKIRILKDFTEGIIRYTAGSVVETRDIDWALGLIEKGFAERVAVEVPVEVKPKPPPPTAPPEEVFRPPPKKPPEVPVKVLPPIPEVCPHDGTPLKEMTRVPLLIKDPLRLEPEEEYWRARMGVPLPTAVVEWIEVPVTMRVWMCEQDHYFERDARGRLVEVSPEFLYRKILREAARIRRIEEVPGVPEVIPPEVRTRFLDWMKRFVPPGPERKAVSLHPRDWLLSRYNMTWGDFLKKDDYERKRLLEEYERESREGK